MRLGVWPIERSRRGRGSFIWATLRDGYPAAPMDFFLAGCQGAGLAVAAGALAGAPGRRGTAGVVLLVLAVIGGAALYGIALENVDHPAWPGWPVGGLIAAGTFLVVRGIAEGAGRRGGSDAFTAGLIALAALAVAGLSLLLKPLGLVALLAVVYLGLARRRRADRKYEGLRTLR